jgi:hypothetical protein
VCCPFKSLQTRCVLIQCETRQKSSQKSGSCLHRPFDSIGQRPVRGLVDKDSLLQHHFHAAIAHHVEFACKYCVGFIRQKAKTVLKLSTASVGMAVDSDGHGWSVTVVEITRTMVDKKIMAARMTRLTAHAAGLALIVGVAGQCWAQSLTTTEKGLLGGGVLGAGTGAIVGTAVHHPVKGALIGGGIGAVAGGVVGHELQTRDQAQYRLQSEVSAQQRQIERQWREIEELQQEQATE